MKGLQSLIDGIKAAYPYFYCESQEVGKTVKDIEVGLSEYYKVDKNGVDYTIKTWNFEAQGQYNEPSEMFAKLENIQNNFDSVPAGTIIIATNFNWFMNDDYGNFDKAKTTWLLNRTERFSSPEYRKILIVVGNIPFEKAIPDILKREFAQITFDLPDEDEIRKIYDFIIDSVKDDPKFKMPSDKERSRIISAAKGLTYNEIIKVFSYTLIKGKGEFSPQVVEELRAAEINSTPGLSLRTYSNKLDDLKGYDKAKEIVDEWINDPRAKGVLLLGPAGVGKTHFCQSLASYYNRMIIEVEFAQLMGDGLVGQAEKAMKRALDVIRANANPEAPIIVMVDEIEKGLAGTSGAGGTKGANDGGTTDRSNAQFLKFLSDDRPPGIYLVASCNDIEKLPAAYVRTGRFDTSPIFIDLPNATEKKSILMHYQEKYSIKRRIC